MGALEATTTQSQITYMDGRWAKVIPDIDGTFTEDEWADARHISFNHTDPSPGHDPDFIHIYIKNTDSKLFLLFDDLPDNTSEVDDHLWVFFDANWDEVIDENLTMFLDRDHDPGNTNPGNDFAEWAIGFGASPHKETHHTIIEVVISITFDDSYDGSSTATELNNTLPVGTENSAIRVMFSAATYLCGWEVPQDGAPGFVETYGTLTLATSPPIKLFVIVLIVIGAVIFAGVVIGGIRIIIKRR